MSKLENYTNVILEDINSKLDFVLETLSPLLELPVQMRQLQSDVDGMKADNQTFKLVMKDHSAQLKVHDGRLIILETA